MFPEGFLVLVNIKMVGEGGIFLFLLYPVLKLEICPVACKRKQIIFKRKKKNQTKVLLVSLFHSLHKWRMQNVNSSSSKFWLGIQPKRKETKKYFWIQRFVHWISLKKVSMCAHGPVSPLFIPMPDAVFSYRD